MTNHDLYLYRDAHLKQWRRDRRERIATAALQGMLSDPGASGTATEYAEYATQYADALIAELDKEAKP